MIVSTRTPGPEIMWKGGLIARGWAEGNTDSIQAPPLLVEDTPGRHGVGGFFAEKRNSAEGVSQPHR